MDDWVNHHRRKRKKNEAVGPTYLFDRTWGVGLVRSKLHKHTSDTRQREAGAPRPLIPKSTHGHTLIIQRKIWLLFIYFYKYLLCTERNTLFNALLSHQQASFHCTPALRIWTHWHQGRDETLTHTGPIVVRVTSEPSRVAQPRLDSIYSRCIPRCLAWRYLPCARGRELRRGASVLN